MENFIDNIIPDGGEWGTAIFAVLYLGFILKLISGSGDKAAFYFWAAFIGGVFLFVMWFA